MITSFSAYITKGDNITSPKFIKDSINKFWLEEVSQIPSDSKILITLRVKIQGENNTEDLKTISNLMKVDINEKQRVIDYFTGRMMLKTTEYKPSNFTALVIVYKFYTEPNSNMNIHSFYGETDSLFEIIESNKEVLKEKISSYEIPITTDITKWGDIKIHNFKTNTFVIDKPSSTLKYVIESTEKANYVKESDTK